MVADGKQCDTSQSVADANQAALQTPEQSSGSTQHTASQSAAAAYADASQVQDGFPGSTHDDASQPPAHAHAAAFQQQSAGLTHDEGPSSTTEEEAKGAEVPFTNHGSARDANYVTISMDATEMRATSTLVGPTSSAVLTASLSLMGKTNSARSRSMTSSTAPTQAKTTGSRSRSRTSSDAATVAKTNSSRSRTSSAASVQSVKSARSEETLGHRVRTNSDDITQEIMNIASFEGCEDVLRGSHLSVILRNQGSIFANSAGNAATYALSKSTKIIDAFISHNWCVPRWQKWLCLSFHFNLRIAVGLTFLTMSPLCVFCIYGWVPITHPEFAPYPRSYVFRLVLFPCFVFFLCFYRDIVRCFPTWSPIVFLDKTCIHQEDKAIQRKGIEKLGAFLCYSKTMVICYTDIYMFKLWTVYEVASFMSLHSVDQIKVIPVMFPVVFILCLCCFAAAGVLGLWPELVLEFYYTLHFFLFAMCYGIVVVFRRWSRSKVAIRRTVATFEARNCKCFCESDRPLVYANIAALMRETQDIGKDASEEAALLAFDNLVRNHLYDALISSVGKYSMRYEHALACGTTWVVPVLDQLVGVACGMPLRAFCSYAIWYATISGFVQPTAFMAWSTWTDLCLELTGLQEKLFLGVGLMAVFVFITVMRMVLDLMEMWANQSDLGLAVFVFLFAISSAMAYEIMDDYPCTTALYNKVSNAKRKFGKLTDQSGNGHGAEIPQAEKVVRTVSL